MTEAPISPLRRRMIEDMTIRKFAPRTQEGCMRAVKGFSAFLDASPDRASFEDLRRYQLHLVGSGTGTPTINHSVTALRFLFIVTLRKPQVVIRLPFIREPRKLPIVLSPEEVASLLDAVPSLKYKAAPSVAYGAGLRASEITCAHTRIAYNSCRNRHCPKCQGAAAREWLAEREAGLLPVPYCHVVFTLPAPIADIAYQNKAVIYGILFKAAADTPITIAADPKHTD
jgi:Transposase zinc-binding domain/Phage integrase, N-terminal SAM-like domain